MKPLSEFFWSIHRSITDPGFFSEAQDFPARRVWTFLLSLLVFSILVTGGAHSYYFLKASGGFASKIGVAFEDTEIRNGILVPPRPCPYTVRADLLSEALQLAVGFANVNGMMPDSFMVVDTDGATGFARTSSVYFQLTGTHIVMNPHLLMAYAIPYTVLFGRTGIFRVDPVSVQAYIEARRIQFMAYFMLQDGLLGFMNQAVTLIFLFLAAYILNFQSGNRRTGRFTMAVYASVPVVLGTSIEALAGTHIKGTWFLFTALSIVVLVRGVRASMPKPSVKENG
jgi:hypothetical protein